MKNEDLRTRILFSIVFVAVSCAKKGNPSEILGTYKTAGWGLETEISFHGEGDFRYTKTLTSCFGSSSLECVKGTFYFFNDLIVLKPTSFRIKHYDWQNPNRKRALALDSICDIKNLNDFHDTISIVRWNKKLFLLGARVPSLSHPEEFSYDDNSMISFLNHFNKDPVNFSTDTLFSYWYKECKTCVETELLKALSPRWRYYIHPSKIEGEVTKIEPLYLSFNRVSTLVTINVGRNNGVYPGFEFHSNVEPKYIVILESLETSSKGLAAFSNLEDCSLGVKMATLSKATNN